MVDLHCSLTLSDSFLEQELLTEEKEILELITVKKQEIQEFSAKVQRFFDLVMKRGGLVYRDIIELEQKFHEKFQSIIIKHKKTHNQVQENYWRSLYLYYQEKGVINPMVWEEEQIESQPIMPDEKQSIRQIYYRLMRKFHPDQVQDEKAILLYQQISNKINEAYEENNLLKLKEIEEKYQSESSLIELDNCDVENSRVAKQKAINQQLRLELIFLEEKLFELLSTQWGQIIYNNPGINFEILCDNVIKQMEQRIKQLTDILNFSFPDLR